MNAAKRSRYRIWTVATVALLALPIRGSAQPSDNEPRGHEEKSAEDILKHLLGGERGAGNVRGEHPGTPGAEPRVAVPIHFRYDSADITPESMAQLGQVAQALNDPRLRSARIRIEGHTDMLGSDAYNLRLSARRAEAVKQLLVEKEGISAERLIAKGYGKTRPLPDVSQDTEEGRAATRRVEFVNLDRRMSSTAPTQATAAHQTLTVNVAVTYDKGGQHHVLTPGSVLAPGDSYRVTFMPERTGYVYVYQIDAAGNVSAVFPNSGYSAAANPVQGKQRYLVPSKGKGLLLDQHPGDQEIVVLAAENALANPEVVAVHLHTSPLDSTTRGPAPNMRGDVAGELPAGVFSYRLPFQHR